MRNVQVGPLRGLVAKPRGPSDGKKGRSERGHKSSVKGGHPPCP